MNLEWLSFHVLPGRCLLCEQPSRRARDLCAACEFDLPVLGNACPRCATPIPRSALACGACLTHPPPQQLAHAAFRYAWPLDALIQRFKFHRDLAAGKMLGELFAQEMSRRKFTVPDALVPVPLHPRRLRERGYNQSLLLARVLAERLGLPLCEDLVERRRETAVQSGMNARSRRRNVRNAFAVRRMPQHLAHIAIVDDVMTTGSTLMEIARLLLGSGIAHVEAWTLARVP